MNESSTPSSLYSRCLQPYLFFGGRCEEAIELYRRVLDARVEQCLRFHESPDPVPPGMLPPGRENHIMHAAVRIGPDLLMMSDGCSPKAEPFQGFCLSLSVPTEAEVDRLAQSLSEGGSVRMAPEKTFWSPRFAAIQDQFGVGWMIQVPSADSE